MALRPYSTHTKFPHVLPATRAFPNPPREKQGIWCARYILGSRTPGIRSAYAAPPNPSASSSGRISHSQLLADDPSAPLAAPSVCCVGLACCVVSGAWLVVRGAELPGLVAGVEVAADTSVTVVGETSASGASASDASSWGDSDGLVVSASGLLMYCCSSFCRSSMSCSSFFASSRLWVSSSISI